MKKINNSLRARITALILLLTVTPLLCTGTFIAHRIYQDQLQQATSLQNEVSKWAENELHCLLSEIEEKIIFAGKAINLLEMDSRHRNVALSKLRSSFKENHHADAVEDIMLFDEHINLLALASRTSIAPAFNQKNLQEIRDIFGSPLKNETLYSPIHFCEQSMEPIIMMAVPLIDYKTGKVKGLIVTCIRLNQVWGDAVSIPVGRSGSTFVTDQTGRVIAHSNPSMIINKDRYDISNQAEVQQDQAGNKFIRVIQKAKIGQQDFFIIVERPFKEAFDLTYNVLTSLLVFLGVFLTIGVSLGIMAARKIVQPLELLAETAERIKAGELGCRATATGNDEIGLLATTFNSMTAQLVTDIERRKKAEEALREHQAELENKIELRTVELQQANSNLNQEIKDRNAVEEHLKVSLAEKEILLKEIHHRVKNNMQIISSLLFLQSQHSASPETHGVIRQSIDRIKAMALIHEKLYSFNKLGEIDIEDYIKTITMHLQGTYGKPDKQISCLVHAEKIFLPVDIAIPCGLILNELLTNCFKYAFETKDSGEIRVTLQRTADHRLTLKVRDNGTGMPARNVGTKSTLGMSLIGSLTSQIGGTCEFTTNQGTECLITFTEKPASAARLSPKP